MPGAADLARRGILYKKPSDAEYIMQTPSHLTGMTKLVQHPLSIHRTSTSTMLFTGTMLDINSAPLSETRRFAYNPFENPAFF